MHANPYLHCTWYKRSMDIPRPALQDYIFSMVVISHHDIKSAKLDFAIFLEKLGNDGRALREIIQECTRVQDVKVILQDR